MQRFKQIKAEIMAAKRKVCPGASKFSHDDAVDDAIKALDGQPYGKSTINEAVAGDDGSCVVSVTSGDAYNGTLTGAVVNAVNAALDFWNANVKEGP